MNDRLNIATLDARDSETIAEAIKEAYAISKEIKQAVGITTIDVDGKSFKEKVNAPHGFTKVGNKPYYEYTKEEKE